MTTTPEGRVKAKVKALLKKYNVYHFMPATGGYGRSGIPDIICCVLGSPPKCHGHFVAIECKAKGGRLTALQQRELEHIKSNGGVAVVVDEDGFDYLEGLITGLMGLPAPKKSRLTSSEE